MKSFVHNKRFHNTAITWTSTNKHWKHDPLGWSKYKTWPSGLCGPRPSGDSVAPPPKSAGCSGCSEREFMCEVCVWSAHTRVTVSWSDCFLPGVSFTVIFSGHDVFKQLAACDTASEETTKHGHTQRLMSHHTGPTQQQQANVTTQTCTDRNKVSFYTM